MTSKIRKMSESRFHGTARCLRACVRQFVQSTSEEERNKDLSLALEQVSKEWGDLKYISEVAAALSKLAEGEQSDKYKVWVTLNNQNLPENQGPI